MKFSRFCLLATVVFGSVLLSGCFTAYPRPPKPERAQDYYRVVTADFEGKRIAEYVSEGEVIQDDDGFRFWAVQRRIYEPTVMEFHYPLGRKVTVAASNTVAVPTTKPLWLKCLDGDCPPEAGERRHRIDCPKAK